MEEVYAGRTTSLVRMNTRVDTHTPEHAQTRHDNIFLRINSRATLIKTRPWALGAKQEAAQPGLLSPPLNPQKWPLCVVKATGPARARARDRTLFCSQNFPIVALYCEGPCALRFPYRV